MKRSCVLRDLLFTLLLASASLFTACSFPIYLLVANASDSPVQVRYKVAGPSGAPLDLSYLPSKQTAIQLLLGSDEWRELSNEEYRVDRENRIVTARLMPGELLRVERAHDSNARGGELIYS